MLRSMSRPIVATPLRSSLRPLVVLPATAPQRRRSIATQAASVVTTETIVEEETVVQEKLPPQPVVKNPPGAKASAQPKDVLPGREYDPLYFQSDASVAKWSDPDKPWTSTKPDSPSEVVRVVASAAASGDAETAAYWAYHMARFSFFLGNGAASLVVHAAAETLIKAQDLTRTRPLEQEVAELPLLRLGKNAGNDAAARLWEAYGTWVQDLAWIKAGVYKMPWDMLTPNKQYNPAFSLTRSLNFLWEGTRTLQRRVRNTAEPVWLQGNMYPQYYTKTFHYQTDGWFSNWSAYMYEHSTEVLFQGRQDAMQRSALVPISHYIRSQSNPVSSLRLLEVSAGTGRFHTFIKDNWPDMPTVCSDLSPFYLARARSNMQEWKRLRQPDRKLGGVDGTGVEFRQMAAEKLDLPDESVDIVVCVYLFHELPEAVRRKAVAEWYRVLKPGGLCVFADSYQRGDRPEYDATMHLFGDFNEPYYVSYATDNLGGMFQQAGFIPDKKYMSSATKTLSFVKPLVEISNN